MSRFKRWTEGEVEELRQCVNEYGKDWKKIAKIMQDRSASSLCEAYTNCVIKNNKVGPLSKGDKIYINKHRHFLSLKEMSAHVRRSVKQISNYLYNKYRRITRKRQRRQSQKKVEDEDMSLDRVKFISPDTPVTSPSQLIVQDQPPVDLPVDESIFLLQLSDQEIEEIMRQITDEDPVIDFDKF